MKKTKQNNLSYLQFKFNKVFENLQPTNGDFEAAFDCSVIRKEFLMV